MPSAAAPAHVFAPPDRNVTLLGRFDRGSTYSDVWGYATPPGGEWALIGTREGTSIVDVTNPAAPVEVALIPGPISAWRDIQTWGHHAYIVTEGTGPGAGLQIVDLDAAPAPALVNTYSQNFTTAHTLFIDENGFAHVAGTSAGMRILSLADPVNPVEVGSFGDHYVHEAYVRGGLAYVSEMFRPAIEILDVTRRPTPGSLGSITYRGSYPHDGWLTDDGSYLLHTDERHGGHLRVFDVSNPAAIVQVGEYQRDPEQSIHNVAVRGSFAFAAHYVHGLRVLDLTDPRFPSEVGGYDTMPGLPEDGAVAYDGVWGVYPYSPSGNIYASDISTGLHVFSFTPDFGVVTGTVRDAATLAPLPGVEVHVAGGETVDTLGDGFYRVTGPPGPLSIEFSRFGYETARATVAAAAGEPAAADAALVRVPGGPVAGFVTAAGGAVPLAGARVAIEGTPLLAASDGGGAWEVGFVPEGYYRVRFERAGFTPRVEGVRVRSATGAVAGADLDPALVYLDMESDPGWVVGAPGDAAVRGLWERADPNGVFGGDVVPEDDVTPSPGAVAWVTGSGPPGEGVGVTDVDDGATTLTSAPIPFDPAGVPPLLTYHRWYSNDFSTRGDVFQVFLADGAGGPFLLQETLGQATADWDRVDVDLTPVAAAGSAQIRFVAADLGSAGIVEAAVDEVTVVRTCQVEVNRFLPDADADGVTDACDACPADPFDDADADGACGDADNAPFAANPGQQDADGDGVGDAADDCPAEPDPEQIDSDGDGAGAPCDDDQDADGLPDASDPDRDGDGILDLADLCPDHPDPAQRNFDLDARGDACDEDDGIAAGLRVDADGRITWKPELGADAYRLRRAEAPGPGTLECLGPDRALPQALDPFLPARGRAFHYVVSVLRGGEMPAGFGSDGLPRAVPPCP
jgi:choice-of-anchor B domain-containing protein